MLIQHKLGNLNFFEIKNRQIDMLTLQWYETNKRIMHKRTIGGRELVIRFLEENPCFNQDDVLVEDDDYLVTVDILACEVIILKPATMSQTAAICYEIGNKHLPLFLEGEELVVPFEAPLFRLLTVAGFEPVKEKRKLLHPLKTTVAPHGSAKSASLFSRIMELTTPDSNGY